ncbi:MAG: sulfatase-like hydrolase/transferase [Verrucomicrobiae bacterium]|nr:sulfatase-like hydrolase/transferase [Verrucomicrobiae bacterium]NNJ42298.1 sulfatase-like hydrolase/transferase [Akkermansiaceae bacterium]
MTTLRAHNTFLLSCLGMVFLLSLVRSQSGEMPTPQIHVTGTTLTIAWQGQGTLYGSNTLNADWVTVGNSVSPYVETITASTKLFYRIAYDADKFNEASLSVTLTGSSAAPSDLSELPVSVSFNGVDVDLGNVSRSSQQTLDLDYVIYGLAPGDYTVEAVFASGLQTGTHTIHANTLLMIVDDWGVDASPVDNALPSALLANMPHLSSLASEGLRFTRAYAQPTCSPTRATILTGRQPWQHDVGVPEKAESFSSSEITLPEIFTTMEAPHKMLTVGKWHLGGGDDGFSTRGGWPEFYGITGGAVQNYSNWNKNSNGTSATSLVYTTTDQVNEATSFIQSQAATGTPWFTWVAFNAPHDPFHAPPADLAPAGGYSTIGATESTDSHYYRTMLEALDTEIGRLLASVDPAQTHIIIIGDNGTPGSVVQAPYGNGHAKGSLYSGGNHVPLIVKGPAVTVSAGSTTDKLVHCVDLFSTILELSGIAEPAVPDLAAQNVTSTSIVPILSGTDTADRCVIVESHGENASGRALIVDDYPDYRLFIFNDLDEVLDSPVIEFYHTGSDANEQAPLNIASLTGEALAAYNACIAKDLAMGGYYSDEPTTGFDTLYIELPSSGVSPEVPNLTKTNGTDISVTSVTLDGNAATVIGRVGPGASQTDESDDVTARYWVKVRIAPANGTYPSAHVVFPDQPAGQGGAARDYDSTSILVNAHP